MDFTPCNEFKWEKTAQCGKARAGFLHTAHGKVPTPVFMPVGTVGTVKGTLPSTLKEVGASIVLGNTYHLMLRPTAERVQRLGGLHKMMCWDGPILTDSGGFQVMSLSGLRKMSEEGVTFQSHIDGSRHLLTPERSTEIQHMLDADITMAFDECPALPATFDRLKSSMELSMRWAERSRKAFIHRPGYGQFGIVQGGAEKELRLKSAEALRQIDFEGYAIGGLAVGEPQEVMFDTLDFTVDALPEDKPRYLMGVGTPEDILGAVARGVDMFDCVIPTRAGRTGRVYTSHGVMNIRNAKYADDLRPISENEEGGLKDVSRAYLHHLFKAKEMLGPILLTWHNLLYYQQLMAQIRSAIVENRFNEVADKIRESWAET